MDVRIENKTGLGKGTEIFFDNKQIKNATSLLLAIAVNDPVELAIDFIPNYVSYEGEANIIAVIEGRRYKLIEE